MINYAIIKSWTRAEIAMYGMFQVGDVWVAGISSKKGSFKGVKKWVLHDISVIIVMVLFLFD